MGGRGSALRADYGTEFRTLMHSGGIKYVQRNANNSNTPMESRVPYRTYAEVVGGKVKSIAFMGADGKRRAQMDVGGVKHDGWQAHMHMGYRHDEHGTIKMNRRMRKYFQSVVQRWEARK